MNIQKHDHEVLCPLQFFGTEADKNGFTSALEATINRPFEPFPCHAFKKTELTVTAKQVSK